MAFPAKLGLLLISALTCEYAAHGQLIVSVRAGLIDYSQGAVYLDADRLRAGSTLRQMQPGQTLSTGKGRAEVLLAPAAMMRLGDDALIRIEDTRVTIEKGSVFIEVVELVKDVRLRVFMGQSETEVRRDGLYRFDSSPASVRVYGGEADVFRLSVPLVAKRGQAVDLNRIELSEFEAEPPDPLHTWAAQRSFALFNTSAENRRKQKHWVYIGDGWLWNRNYRIKYRSAQARRDHSWVDEQLRESIPNVPRADSKR